MEEQLWNWEVVKAGLLDVLRNAANDGSSLLAFKQYCNKTAQYKWDSNLRETGGKTYNAHHFKKLAEIVCSLPEYFETDVARGDQSQIWHGFTSRFNTPKPLSHGFCFLDGYRNDERQPAQPDPTNDCYFKLPFNYEAKSIRESDCLVILGRRLTVEEVRQVVIDFIDSFCNDNDGYFATSCASTYCAFYGIHVALIQFALGEGEMAKDCLTSLKQQCSEKRMLP